MGHLSEIDFFYQYQILINRFISIKNWMWTVGYIKNQNGRTEMLSERGEREEERAREREGAVTGVGAAQ